MSTERMLNSLEAAAYLNVGTDTLRIWARTGKLPCNKSGRFFRFRQSDLDKVLNGAPYEPQK
jgi:excisionase family DNA binding protein